ncbi:MAG: hypothetical protein H7274_24145 [Rhodoferax sp.]|nr:hypothetical protein [Rhodoferax sp.]
MRLLYAWEVNNVLLAGRDFRLAFITGFDATAVLGDGARRQGMWGESALPVIVKTALLLAVKAAVLLAFAWLGTNRHLLAELFTILATILALFRDGGIAGAAACKAIGYTLVLAMATTQPTTSAMLFIADARMWLCAKSYSLPPRLQRRTTCATVVNNRQSSSTRCPCSVAASTTCTGSAAEL